MKSNVTQNNASLMTVLGYLQIIYLMQYGNKYYVIGNNLKSFNKIEIIKMNSFDKKKLYKVDNRRRTLPTDKSEQGKISAFWLMKLKAGINSVSRHIHTVSGVLVCSSHLAHQHITSHWSYSL